MKRNLTMHMKRHESEVNKIKEQEMRHKKNVILEKEKYENKQIAIYRKYAGIDRTTEEEKAQQERNDFISCRQEYVDKLSELMIGTL